MKKIESTSRNIDKINKEKMLEYQRKMATLNSEINLTQNLYQNFLQAKSRVNKKEWMSDHTQFNIYLIEAYALFELVTKIDQYHLLIYLILLVSSTNCLLYSFFCSGSCSTLHWFKSV